MGGHRCQVLSPSIPGPAASTIDRWVNARLRSCGRRSMMRKLALLVGAGLLVFGSIDSAEAQRWRGGGWRPGGHWHHGGYGYRYGGALAAGFVGGAVVGGL